MHAEAGSLWELSVPSSQLHREPKTSSKSNLYKRKKEKKLKSNLKKNFKGLF